MNFNRLLNTYVGRAFVSFILGIGIATLFRQVCKDGDCLVFDGPILSEISEDKIFKHNDKCYKYKRRSQTYMPNKKTIPINSDEDEKQKSGQEENKTFSFLDN